MIAFVRGTVASTAPDHLVVDLGPIGLVVQCTPTTTHQVRAGDHVELQTTMVIREDSWTLFGFEEADERAVFEQVQTVSGIGPRIALALLATLSPDDLRSAVATSNEAAITAVPGIGKKGAQRIILELRDKLGAPTGAMASTTTRAGGSAIPVGWQQSVQAALMSLGWSARDAETAVAGLDPHVVAGAVPEAGTPDIATLLKAALRGLDRA